MQISACAANSAPAPTALSSLYNLAVLSTSDVAANGDYTVDATTVPFDDEPSSAGFHMLTRYVEGGARIHATQYLANPREAAARHALADAIDGSGLLTQLQPTTAKGRPDAGLTRIYLDRRSRFIEFANGAAPPAAQAVLDALEAYRLVASRHD
ncbi:MAG: hypothetical protein H7287_00745 [Thermoleophilia bacterium]|nr:hypothetical protein [Thermoleophilia bacterium]